MLTIWSTCAEDTLITVSARRALRDIPKAGFVHIADTSPFYDLPTQIINLAWGP